MSRRLEESPYAFTVPPLEEAVPVARSSVAHRARELGFPLDSPLFDDLKLLTTEVVTNSITHTQASCVVCVRWTGERLRVEVTDVETTLVSPSCAELRDESGRGLLLVDALATAWGSQPCPGGRRHGSSWWCPPSRRRPQVWDSRARSGGETAVRQVALATELLRLLSPGSSCTRPRDWSTKLLEFADPLCSPHRCRVLLSKWAQDATFNRER
ncbi:ATP-binding protein [Streptomyces roseochromogenus]|uniref:ATP-binding protein n=1 Tax=Streptomyces roseochromogenus TaxID=285450 RepID=UPI000D12B9DD